MGRKLAICCLVWKTKMGKEDKNVECTGWFFNTSFLLHQFQDYYDNPRQVYFLSDVIYVSLHGT